MSFYPVDKFIKSEKDQSNPASCAEPIISAKNVKIERVKVETPPFADTSVPRISDVSTNPLRKYRFIEFFTVFSAISNVVICKYCQGQVKFEEKASVGLGFQLVVNCECGKTEVPSCPKTPSNDYEVNRRFVFAMHTCGQALSGINLFCNLMDLCRGFSKTMFHKICLNINNSVRKVFVSSCKNGVEEEKKENEKLKRPTSEIKVSGKALTWKKRGFDTLFGVVPLIAYYSGKVIDIVVKSCFCEDCTKKKCLGDGQNEDDHWYYHHFKGCEKIFEVSTDFMESHATKEMFSSSVEKFGVEYREYDGDFKKYVEIMKLKPYGDEVLVKKFDSTAYKKETFESLYTTIWRLAGKQSCSGQGSVENAAYLAAAIFNDGFAALLQVMNDLEIGVSQHLQEYVELVDMERVKRQSYHSFYKLKQENGEEEACRRAEGLLCIPEIADY